MQKYEFLELMSQAVADDKDEDPTSLNQIYKPVLDTVKRDIQKDASLGNPDLFGFAEMLLFFTRKPCLGEVGKSTLKSKSGEQYLCLSLSEQF